MSCSHFRERWAIGGSEDHADACASCAGWLAGQRRAASALAHLAASLDEGVVPGSRELELRAAFRLGRHPVEASHPWRWTWVLATAAAGLLVAFVVFPRTRPAVHEPSAAPAITAQRAEPVASVAPATRPGAAGVSANARIARNRKPGPVPPAIAPREPQPTSAAPSAPDAALQAEVTVVPLEVASPAVADAESRVTAAVADAGAPAPSAVRRAAAEDEFHPLVPGAETAEMESGQIVRVQLRPDVLDAAGLPPPAGAKGPVEAEVLVGPDGVARGIRLARPRR